MCSVQLIITSVQVCAYLCFCSHLGSTLNQFKRPLSLLFKKVFSDSKSETFLFLNLKDFFVSSLVKFQLCCVFTLREPELVLLDVQSVPAGQEGWLAFDVTTASNHWLLHPRSNLGIRLYVETEEGGCSAR